MSRKDPVSRKLAEEVFARDGRCVVGLLAERGELSDQGPCRDRWGGPILTWGHYRTVRGIDLTIAHVRDRAGGRTSRRPPSVRRHLAAVCAGHHLLDPVVDRADVRPVIDRYLEELEGPAVANTRPWERVPRVRSAALDSTTSDN